MQSVARTRSKISGARPGRTAAWTLAALLAASACSSSGAPSGSATTTSDTALQSEYTSTVDAVLPSVVSISAGSSIGSGVVYDRTGDIITNAHVVGTEQTFGVTLATDPTSLTATLVGTFPLGDLAVIRLSDPPSGLRPASFADSSRLDIGQIVLAMGNPLGLSSTVTQGIVSALGRTISEPPTAQAPTGVTIPDMVQTSAAINPGNSGGALVSLAHQVIGINTLAATDPSQGGSTASGIGFAIPSDRVTSLADQMIKDGRVTDSGLATLGANVRTLASSDGTPAGAVVAAVSAGGPAQQAGIQPGDVITKLGDTPVASAQALSTALAALQPGQKVPVEYTRDGKRATATAVLGTL